MTTLDLRPAGRPRPIVAAFKTVGGAIATLGSVATALVGWGVLTAAEGDAIAGLLGAIPGVVTAVTVLLAAVGVTRRAEPQVTPLEDPRDNDGVPLLPIPGGAESYVHPGDGGLPRIAAQRVDRED